MYMPQGSDFHFHLHIHEGAPADATQAAVVALIARTNGSVPISVDAPDSVDVPIGVDATRPTNTALALARRAYNESDGKMCPLLEFLADNPDRLVPFTEASRALGFPTARSMPGLLGAFGRRANHRYGGVWPFKKVWHNSAWHMRMDADIAEVIRKLRDSAE